MSHKFCQKCGTKVMKTLRMCPSCGSKDMELTPPNLSTVDNHSHKATTSPASGALGNSHNTSPSLSGGLSPAPLFPRFCAYLIDAIIVSIIAAIPVAVASLLSIPIRSEGPSFLMSLAFLASFCLP